MNKPTKRQRIQALQKSIIHWTEDYPKNCDFKEGVFKDNMGPSMSNCPLCQLHYAIISCNNCPLADGFDLWGDPSGCDQGSQFENAVNAVQNKKRPAFMKARYNIIRRMKRALERELNI